MKNSSAVKKLFVKFQLKLGRTDQVRRKYFVHPKKTIYIRQKMAKYTENLSLQKKGFLQNGQSEENTFFTDVSID